MSSTPSKSRYYCLHGFTQRLPSGNLLRFFILYFIPFMDSFRGNYCLLIVAIIQGPFARILLR